MFTHLVRIDRVTHAVITQRARIRRSNTDYTLCATVIDESATVLAPFRIGDDRRHDMTCDRCIRAHTGMEDVLDTDFGFVIDRDDGTGRF